MPQQQQIRRRADRTPGFTLIELLVVITIIAVLIGLLIPMVSKVRDSARKADTASFVNQLANAMDRYTQDFKAPPGPLSNDQVWTTPGTYASTAFAQFIVDPNANAHGFVNTWAPNQVTGNENAVLGLLGGLKAVVNGTTINLVFDPSLVGGGAMSLNPQNPKRYESYLPDAAKFLSWHDAGNNLRSGGFSDESCPQIQDTIIPEFVDTYPSPMPILILRARPGASARDNAGQGPTVATANGMFNGVVNDVAKKSNQQQYDLDQIIAYTGAYNDAGVTENPPGYPAPGGGFPRSVGVGKKVPTYYYNNQVTPVTFPYHGLRTTGVAPNAISPLTPGDHYTYPLPAFPYLQNPQIPFTARQKDGYILIAAGPDRMYGTNDDIVNFGSVQP